jgi:hypothetical protein
MAADRTHRLWLQGLNAHVRAVHAHEATAALFQRMGEAQCAAIESRRAAGERIAYAHAAAQHPEWSADVSITLTARHAAGIGGRVPRVGTDSP